jgi:hypothetical protein
MGNLVRSNMLELSEREILYRIAKDSFGIYGRPIEIKLEIDFRLKEGVLK